MPSFEPLSPPSHVCPKCLGWWAHVENGYVSGCCASQGSCPDHKLCEQLYGDHCIVIVQETDQLEDRGPICWHGGQFCLLCNRENCEHRKEGQEV